MSVSVLVALITHKTPIIEVFTNHICLKIRTLSTVYSSVNRFWCLNIYTSLFHFSWSAELWYNLQFSSCYGWALFWQYHSHTQQSVLKHPYISANRVGIPVQPVWKHNLQNGFRKHWINGGSPAISQTELVLPGLT